MGAKKKRATKPKTTNRRGKSPEARRDLSPPVRGDVLKRTFKGDEYVVRVTADGFRYAGETYRTLTAVAKQITGYASVSGPRFFGIDEASREAAE